jgi:hypothetical protein
MTASPRELFTGIKLDYRRDLRLEFGEYCEVHTAPPKDKLNTSIVRTTSSIGLHGVGNDRGTCWFMDLEKLSFYQADHWTAQPMTDLAVERVNYVADLDEIAHNKRKPPVLIAAADRDDSVPGTTMDNNVQDLIVLPSPRAAVSPEAVSPFEPDAEHLGAETSPDPDAAVAAPAESGDTFEDVSQAGPSALDSDVVDEVSAPPGPIEDPGEHFDPRNFNAGSRFIAGQRRSYRLSANMLAKRTLLAYKLSIARALAKNEAASKAAIRQELKQMVDKNVWEVVDRANLTKAQLKSVIRSSLFLKEKFDASGAFVKLKARLVAGGDRQDKSLYDDLSSPTVCLESVMEILAIAASEGRKVVTADITGAFLECALPEGDDVTMALDPIVTKILCELDEMTTPFVGEDGRVFVKLRRALYGCVQSSMLWYKKLQSVLLSNGYVANPYDPCVFNKIVEGKQVTIAFHVDDLLITSALETGAQSAIEILLANFTDVTVTRGNRHPYLGMNIIVSESGISVDMIAYIEKILETKTCGKRVTTPATENLFDIPQDSPALSSGAAKNFHSDVAKLLFLAKRTRLEILTAVSHLSSRVRSPAVDDEVKLNRVFDYLFTTKGALLRFHKTSKVEVTAYIDASFGVHADGTSRTGVIIMMSGGAVAGWSGKQKIVTKSSTEAEIVALTDGLTHVLWCREWLTWQGHDVSPVLVHQDNQGVIAIMTTGSLSRHRTKHLNVRYFFAKCRIDLGEIRLGHMNAEDMIADLLTKPVMGDLFRRLVKMLHGHEAL